MRDDVLLLGVDGGGTRCRARLADATGNILGEGLAGPANVRLDPDGSLAAVREAAGQCLGQAKLAWQERPIVACLALAGAGEPRSLASGHQLPRLFDRTIFTHDARAACMGAHAGEDGAIIIVGTGSVGLAILEGKEYRVGGWGLPLSDEGSGAWLGCEVLRRALWAGDGLAPWSGLLREVFERFDCDGHELARWMSAARPRDLGGLAPLVVAHAAQGDAEACKLMRLAAGHIDRIASRLLEFGDLRLSLMGGLADVIEPYLTKGTTSALVAPRGDALTGALRLARAEAERSAHTIGCRHE